MLSRREALALPLLLAGVAGPDAAASDLFDRQKWRSDAHSTGRNVGEAGADASAPDEATDAAGDAPREAEAFAAPVPEIRPRSAWATNHPVRGTLVPEEDVRFLLVHHTLTPNTDTPAEIPGRIRSIYAFHTGERGWADVAYNFFVDPSGVVWEGREGSLAGPVQADATGGSQGFAQLGCFIGDFRSVVPTPAAMDAMVRLLAWLAGRSGLSLEGTATFVSRGSSKWARGVEVTTARVAAHRDMSVTECPGDALYPLVAGELLPRAAESVAAGAGAGASVSPGAGESGTPGGSAPGASAGSSGSGGSPGSGGSSGSGDGTGGAAGGDAEGSGWGRVALPGLGEVPVEGVVAGVAGVALAGGAIAWGVRSGRGRSGRVGSAPEESARAGSGDQVSAPAGSSEEGSAHQQQRDERQTADEQRDDQPDEEPGQGL